MILWQVGLGQSRHYATRAWIGDLLVLGIPQPRHSEQPRSSRQNPALPCQPQIWAKSSRLEMVTKSEAVGAGDSRLDMNTATARWCDRLLVTWPALRQRMSEVSAEKP